MVLSYILYIYLLVFLSDIFGRDFYIYQITKRNIFYLYLYIYKDINKKSCFFNFIYIKENLEKLLINYK